MDPGCREGVSQSPGLRGLPVGPRMVPKRLLLLVLPKELQQEPRHLRLSVVTVRTDLVCGVVCRGDWVVRSEDGVSVVVEPFHWRRTY